MILDESKSKIKKVKRMKFLQKQQVILGKAKFIDRKDAKCTKFERKTIGN